MAEAEHRQRVELWIFALLEHRVNLWHCRRPAEHHLRSGLPVVEARLEAGARGAGEELDGGGTRIVNDGNIGRIGDAFQKEP